MAFQRTQSRPRIFQLSPKSGRVCYRRGRPWDCSGVLPRNHIRHEIIRQSVPGEGKHDDCLPGLATAGDGLVPSRAAPEDGNLIIRAGLDALQAEAAKDVPVDLPRAEPVLATPSFGAAREAEMLVAGGAGRCRNRKYQSGDALAAPSGPRNPKISPGGISKLMPRTASVKAYCLRTPPRRPPFPWFRNPRGSECQTRKSTST